MFNFNKSTSDVDALLQHFDPYKYANSRNYIKGNVSFLSPYITHGILTLPEIHYFLNKNFYLKFDNKFFKELAWREFFYHVWMIKQNKIFSSIKPDFNMEKYHSNELPLDIRNASTGLKLIDNIVKSLYEYGYIHNHARMWLASYIIHFRKIDWRLGADWLYSHLLDGDLASNHLSWQWIAGSFSNKPYIFNADNVSKYAPVEWSCKGTFLDDSYQNLLHFANSKKKIEGGVVTSRIEPALFKCPNENLQLATSADLKNAIIIHPWCVRRTQNGDPHKNKIIGVFFERFHAKWPWSEKRWNFVLKNMKLICDEVYWCKESVHIEQSFIEENLHLDFIFKNKSNKLFVKKRPNIWPEQQNYCSSFTQFWKRASKDGNKQYSLFV